MAPPYLSMHAMGKFDRKDISFGVWGERENSNISSTQ